MTRKQDQKVDRTRGTLVREQQPDGTWTYILVGDTGAVSDVRPPGRPAGSGHAGADAALVAEMVRLFESGQVKSMMGAARLVAWKAVGGGSRESRAARLLGRLKK